MPVACPRSGVADQCWVLTLAGKPVFTLRGGRLSAANVRPCGLFCALAAASRRDGGTTAAPLTAPLCRLAAVRRGPSSSYALVVSLDSPAATATATATAAASAGAGADSELLLVWGRQCERDSRRGERDGDEGARFPPVSVRRLPRLLARVRDVVWSVAPGLSQQLRRSPSMDPAATVFSEQDRRAWRRFLRWCAGGEACGGLEAVRLLLPAALRRRWLKDRRPVPHVAASTTTTAAEAEAGVAVWRLFHVCRASAAASSPALAVRLVLGGGGGRRQLSGRDRLLLRHAVVEVCRTWGLGPVAAGRAAAGAACAGPEAFVPLWLPGSGSRWGDDAQLTWLHLCPVLLLPEPGAALALAQLVDRPDGFASCHAVAQSWRRDLALPRLGSAVSAALQGGSRGSSAWEALRLPVPVPLPVPDAEARGPALRYFLVRLRDGATAAEGDENDGDGDGEGATHVSGRSPWGGAAMPSTEAYFTQAIATVARVASVASVAGLSQRGKLWIGLGRSSCADDSSSSNISGNGDVDDTVWCCLRLPTATTTTNSTTSSTGTATSSSAAAATPSPSPSSSSWSLLQGLLQHDTGSDSGSEADHAAQPQRQQERRQQQVAMLVDSVQWVCAAFAAGTARREVLAWLSRLLRGLSPLLLGTA